VGTAWTCTPTVNFCLRLPRCRRPTSEKIDRSESQNRLCGAVLPSFLLSSFPSFPSFPSFLSNMSSIPTLASRVIDTLSALHAEDRYYDQLADQLADQMIALSLDAETTHAVLDIVVHAIFARDLVTPPQALLSQQDEALADWSVPDLTERRAIWRNFPVVVRAHELGCADGKDRYDILWHKDNYVTWRLERSETYDEYVEYDDWTMWRMEHAFQTYSHIYTVEPSSDVDVLYRIAVAAEDHTRLRAIDVLREQGLTWKRDGVNHDVRIPMGKSAEEKTALIAALRACSDCVVTDRTGFLCRVIIGDAKAVADAIADAEPTAVAAVTKTAIEVLSRFPVTWDRSGKKIHDIKVHFGKCLRKNIPTMTADLLTALRSCKDCSVSGPAGGDYICRVVLK